MSATPYQTTTWERIESTFGFGKENLAEIIQLRKIAKQLKVFESLDADQPHTDASTQERTPFTDEKLLEMKHVLYGFHFGILSVHQDNAEADPKWSLKTTLALKIITALILLF